MPAASRLRLCGLRDGLWRPPPLVRSFCCSVANGTGRSPSGQGCRFAAERPPAEQQRLPDMRSASSRSPNRMPAHMISACPVIIDSVE